MVHQFGAIHLKNKMKIFILQKRCMRLITFSNFKEHTTPIFKNFEILKLQDITEFNTLKRIYSYYQDQLPLTIKYILLKINLLTRIIPEVESFLLYHKLIQLILV